MHTQCFPRICDASPHLALRGASVSDQSGEIPWSRIGRRCVPDVQGIRERSSDICVGCGMEFASMVFSDLQEAIRSCRVSRFKPRVGFDAVHANEFDVLPVAVSHQGMQATEQLRERGQLGFVDEARALQAFADMRLQGGVVPATIGKVEAQSLGVFTAGRLLGDHPIIFLRITQRRMQALLYFGSSRGIPAFACGLR